MEPVSSSIQRSGRRAGAGCRSWQGLFSKLREPAELTRCPRLHSSAGQGGRVMAALEPCLRPSKLQGGEQSRSQGAARKPPLYPAAEPADAEEQSQAVGWAPGLQAAQTLRLRGPPPAPQLSSPLQIPVRSGRSGAGPRPPQRVLTAVWEARGRGGYGRALRFLEAGTTRHTGRTRGPQRPPLCPVPARQRPPAGGLGPSPAFPGGRPKLVALGL